MAHAPERNILVTAKKKRRFTQERIKENIELYSLMIPVMILITVFAYIPIYGAVVAFQDYAPGQSFIAFDGSVKWVGLKHFRTFFASEYFTRLLGNTLRLGFLELIFGFWVPIIFALLLNEVRHARYKKFVQTASYMPYFISTVVVAGMVISFINVGGLINTILTVFGADAVNWRMYSEAFPTIYTATHVWKNFGFSSILYLSSISSIDPSLYESARIDGGNRFQQMWYITMPGLRNIIAIRLILAVGAILNASTELILLLYVPATYDTADVMGTYIYRIGILGGNFSYTAAIGLFMSLIGFTLTLITNHISNKLTGSGLW